MPLKVELDDVQFLGRSTYTTLPDANISGSMGDVVPDVTNINLLILKNTSPINLTNFNGGADGQYLQILGDGFSTLKNNSNIVTSAGVDKLLGIHIYNLTYYNGKWYEDG